MKRYVFTSISGVALLVMMASNGFAADCATTISVNTTLAANCTISLSGLDISSGITLTTNNYRISNSANSGTVNNAGTLIATTYGFYIGTPFGVTGTISGFTNSGAVIASTYGIYVGESGNITNFTNTATGTISGSGSYIIGLGGSVDGGDIDNFNNAGSIYSDGFYAITNGDTSIITTLTNTGTITGAFLNPGAVTTLNNAQGSSSALKWYSNVPENYNVIINSPTDYGKIVFAGVSGSTNFGIYSTSTLTESTTYSAVITGLSSGNIASGTSGTFTSGSTSYTWELTNSSGTIWDLLVGLCTGCGPSISDTQASIQDNAMHLRGVFNGIATSTNFANMNTYDCNLFDVNGMCISVGGRYTNVNNPNSNATSTVAVLGYKASPNIRIGGFLDQNVNNNTPTGIKISNKNPLMGAFAVWNQNADGFGYQVKVANAYQDKDVSTTRNVIGTSEAGRGDTNINIQSYVGELSYALAYQDKTLLRPYLALRHTTIKQDAYTETGVSTPLTYASLKDRSLTALVGLKLNHALTPKATLTASFGIEQDLEHQVDQYSATSAGISGLTSENFNDSIKRTRPVASAGAYYAASKTQRISMDIYYQQLPFQSTGSTTAYFNYTIGF